MTRIEIGFITNEEYDADEDYKEFVVIKSISEDRFSFIYTAPCDDGLYTKKTEYNKEQLLAWFRGAFRLGVIAIDSYKAFQFLFPIVPPFKIPPEKLDNKDQFDSLLDLFSKQLDFMDNEDPTPSPSPDEESDTSSQEDPMPSPIVEEESEPSPTPQEVASVPVVASPQEVSVPRRSSRIRQQRLSSEITLVGP